MPNTFGFMRGNHTFKCFTEINAAIEWVNNIDNYDELQYFEMAFVDNINLHRNFQESDLEFVKRSYDFFKYHMKKPKVMSIQEYLIP